VQVRAPADGTNAASKIGISARPAERLAVILHPVSMRTEGAEAMWLPSGNVRSHRELLRVSGSPSRIEIRRPLRRSQFGSQRKFPNIRRYYRHMREGPETGRG
jgi:hypothetical protein